MAPASFRRGDLVDVALPLPLARTFSYRLDGAAAAGTRVRVPFGQRRLIGWIVGPGQTGAGAPVKDVLEVLDPEEPSVPADLLDLCRWIADYYLAPVGQVLRAALPAALSAPTRADPRPRTRRLLRVARTLPSLLEREEVFGRAGRQRECYELLESSGGAAEASHLTQHAGFSASVLQGLVAKGLCVFVEEEETRDPFTHLDALEPARHTPTERQAQALTELIAAARALRPGGRGEDGGRRSPPPAAADPRPFLLRGVTGSGKTLVYIELLAEVVERQGRGAIVLVPEIALTPQTVGRFRSRFGDTVAVLHSALSEGERYDAWRALKGGERRIAVGARSAIFAPVRDLGAIIVDEEHESSYKQSETPRYHAREVAVMRARLAGAVCVLGSATPALESWSAVEQRKFRLLELPERVEGRPLPPVRLVDLRRKKEGGGAAGSPSPTGSAAAGRGPTPILSPLLVEAVTDRLARGEQSILLLNRRGYATFVQCRDCGEVWSCPACNVSLTYHRGRGRLVCHYCLHEEAPPTLCERCGGEEISFRGVGTEQVERSVVEAFPAARIARMDVDTTSGKWAHHHILGRVERGEVDILLGTQMIAKGLDFPRVTLVGVVNADVGMNLPDFRASERTFQLLTQVAGRAGRGALGGEVLVQTALPHHYAIEAALSHDYVGFARREMEERSGPAYPPHSRMINIVASATEEEAARTAAEGAAEWTLEALRADGVGGAVVLTGPAPCVIDRIRGRWRWHFLLRSASTGALSHIGRRLLTEYPLRAARGEVRIILDRDPVALL